MNAYRLYFLPASERTMPHFGVINIIYFLSFGFGVFFFSLSCFCCRIFVIFVNVWPLRVQEWIRLVLIPFCACVNGADMSWVWISQYNWMSSAQTESQCSLCSIQQTTERNSEKTLSKYLHSVRLHFFPFNFNFISSSATIHNDDSYAIFVKCAKDDDAATHTQMRTVLKPGEVYYYKRESMIITIMNNK